MWGWRVSSFLGLAAAGAVAGGCLQGQLEWQWGAGWWQAAGGRRRAGRQTTVAWRGASHPALALACAPSLRRSAADVGDGEEAIANRTVRVQVVGSPLWPTVTGADGHQVGTRPRREAASSAGADRPVRRRLRRRAAVAAAVQRPACGCTGSSVTAREAVAVAAAGGWRGGASSPAPAGPHPTTLPHPGTPYVPYPVPSLLQVLFLDSYLVVPDPNLFQQVRSRYRWYCPEWPTQLAHAHAPPCPGSPVLLLRRPAAWPGLWAPPHTHPRTRTELSLSLPLCLTHTHTHTHTLSLSSQPHTALQ